MANQVSYVEKQGVGRPGQMGTTRQPTIDAYVVESTTAGTSVVMPGRFVAQGTADQECKPYTAATDAVLGGAIKDIREVNGKDEIPETHHVSTISVGDLWMELQTNTGCVKGASARVSHATGEEGRVTSATTDSTVVTGVYFRQTVTAPGAGSNALVLVRFATGDLYS